MKTVGELIRAYNWNGGWPVLKLRATVEPFDLKHSTEYFMTRANEGDLLDNEILIWPCSPVVFNWLNEQYFKARTRIPGMGDKVGVTRVNMAGESWNTQVYREIWKNRRATNGQMHIAYMLMGNGTPGTYCEYAWFEHEADAITSAMLIDR